MTDSALTELLLQTGPLGTLVVVLGGLVRSWIAGVGSKLDLLTNQLQTVASERVKLELRVDALERRVERIEYPPTKGGA